MTAAVCEVPIGQVEEELVGMAGRGGGSGRVCIAVEPVGGVHQLTPTLTAIGLTADHADVPDSPGGGDG